jgi:hypothetical protein
VSEKRGKRLFLDPRTAEAQITLLLVDLSGPVVDSEDLPELVKAVKEFTERLGRAHHDVAVSAFDGGDALTPMLAFGADDTAGLDAMKTFRPHERNSNLNGAIFQGLAALEKQMAAASAGRKVGNLVVFTDRGDLAHKVSAEVVDTALDKTPADVYLIATGDGIKKAELASIARTDAFYSTQSKDLRVGFTQLGKHLESASLGHYVLSYCSPKRKGEHKLEIEVVTETDRGKMSETFSADGFKKGCTPKHRPAFAKKEEAGAAEKTGGDAEAGGGDETQAEE